MPVKKLDLDLLPQVKSREVRAKRKVLAKILEGSWTALTKGTGMEFAGFCKYTYGDDAGRIDWGASLRANETLIREFEEYKNVNILFLLDLSDTMLFTSQKKMKAEYAAEMMFTLAVAFRAGTPWGTCSTRTRSWPNNRPISARTRCMVLQARS